MIQEYINNKYKYFDLLDKLIEISNKFSFVIRPEFTISVSEKEIFSLFEKYLILETEVESWPGTILLCGKKAHIFYYLFNQETLTLLKRTCNNLFKWRHPEKPEDLCFYKDDIPVFGSISHERESFFIYNKEEKK